MFSNGLHAKFRNARLLALDVDGVLTDGGLMFDSNGVEYKTFNVHDGYGVRRVQEAGILVAIVTGRESGIVARRAQELGIKHVVQSASDKGEALSALAEKLGIELGQVVYVGDDLPDLPAMRLAGIAVAVANAVETVRDEADIVTPQKGGEGAVREVCERLIRARE